MVRQQVWCVQNYNVRQYAVCGRCVCVCWLAHLGVAVPPQLKETSNIRWTTRPLLSQLQQTFWELYRLVFVLLTKRPFVWVQRRSRDDYFLLRFYWLISRRRRYTSSRDQGYLYVFSCDGHLTPGTGCTWTHAHTPLALCAVCDSWCDLIPMLTETLKISARTFSSFLCLLNVFSLFSLLHLEEVLTWTMVLQRGDRQAMIHWYWCLFRRRKKNWSLEITRTENLIWQKHM